MSLQDRNVILCSLCGFRGFSFFQIARHLRLHSEASFRCGIEDCPSLFTNLTFFQSHLREFHDDIYPIIQSVLPELVNSSFSYPADQGPAPNSDVAQANDAPGLDLSIGFSDSFEPALPDGQSDYQDEIMDGND